MTELASNWENIGYQPIGYVRHKMIARYLRTQRKNMRRFFLERGFFALAERMNEIRKSNHGMMAKNRQFQKVLDEYAALTSGNGKVVSSIPGTPEAVAIAGETTDQ